MTAPWSCSTCGAPGVRNLGTQGYCAAHLTAFLRDRISPETWAWAGGGVGLPRLLRPDHGDGWAELDCSCCDATWVGASFERCGWCATALERQIQWQAEIVLTAPDVEPADRAYDDRMRAWADRLARGVEAGFVTRERALAVWRKVVDRVDVAA